MDKRNRSRLVAVGGLIGGALLTAWITLTGFELTRSDIAARDIERGNASAYGYDANEPDQCINLTSPEGLEDCKRQQAAAQHQKQHTEADLHAQSDMASFARGLLWFTAFGFVASAAGLVALIWTFREQRKLTTNQSRAYLELVSAHYTADRFASIDEGEDTEDTIWVSLTLHNNGETPALNVSATFVFHCTTETDGFGTGGDSYKIKDISGALKEIPAKGTYVLRAHGKGVLPHATMKHTNWRAQGPSLRAAGKVTFEDVFGSPLREMAIELDAPHIPNSFGNPPVEFYGPHRNRADTDRELSHVRARLEKERAERVSDAPNEGKE